VVYDKYYRGQHKLFYVTGYSIVPFYFVDMYVFMSHGIVCLTDIVPFYFVDMYVYQEPFSLSLPSSASITVLGSVPYIKTTKNNRNKEHTLYLCYYTKYNQQYTGEY
jgi:hypothetical protein